MKELGKNGWYAKDVGPFLKKAGYSNRVENSMGQGMADNWYAIDGTQGALETKIVKGNQIYFRQFQIPWMLAMRRHSYAVWVLALLNDEDTVILINAEQFRTVELGKSGRYTTVKVQNLKPKFAGSRQDSTFWEGLRIHLGSHGPLE